jgi:hypothetical protein
MGQKTTRARRAAVAVLTVAASAAAWLAAPGSAAAAPGAAPLACAAPGRGVTACETAASAAAPAAGAISPAQSGTAPAGYSPAQLQAAYHLPSASAGTKKTVAVVAPYDDPDAASDLAAYRSQFGLPACAQTLSQSAPQCLTEISESGALITPGSGTAPAANTSWALQTSAQLDAISAACPECQFLLVEVNSPTISDIGAGVNFAADLGAKVITIGDAQPETSADPTSDTAYFDHPGVAITAAAGNSGYSGTGVDYPAASQYVTAVGGTTLTPAGTGTCTTALAGARGWCESAWDDAQGVTTSGCALYDPEPAWQASGLPAADTGCGGLRMVADVSADADPATGIAVYDSYGEGGWQGGTGIGGTSVAAALIAGVYAIAGTPAPGTYPASYPYADAGGLNDISTGSTSTSTCTPSYLCTAGPGYDAPTGLGTPDGVSAFLPAFLPAGPVAFNPAHGTEEMYATGTSGTPFQDSWSSATGWSGWANLSGVIASKPAALFNPASGSMQVYGVASTGTTYEDSWTPAGGWAGWTSLGLGATLDGSLAAVYDPVDGAMQVYGIGRNGTTYEDSWTSARGWTGWTSLGGTLDGSLAAVYDPMDGATEIYGVASNGTTYEDSWTPAGGWAGWKSLGGDVKDSVAAFYDPASGSMQVYALGPAGTSYVDSWTPAGGWAGWANLGGTLNGGLAAGYDPLDGAMEIFGVASNGTTYEDSWTSAGGWAGWKSLGGDVKDSLAAVYDPASRSMQVYALGPDELAYVDSSTPAGGWAGWANLGGTFADL